MSFLLESVVVIVSVLLAGQISRRLGQPSVLGQLLVGVLLGPALLGWLEPTPLVKEMAEIGVILLMFMAGLETNINDIRKAAVPATLVAVGGVALPFVGGWGLAAAWGYAGATAVFIGVLLVATSVSISAQTLRELGHLKSRPGVIILAAAVLDDVLGILVLSVVLGMVGGEAAGAHGGGHGAEPPLILIAKIFGFFAVAALVGWKILPRVVKWVSRFEAGTAVLATGIAVALGFAYAAEASGLAGIIGAYLAGLMLSLTDYRGKLMHEVEHTAFAFFVPFFFVSVGLTANFAGVGGSFLVFILILTVVAIVTKLVGGGLGAKLSGLDFRQSAGIGAGMVARGEVGLIVAAIGLDRGLLGSELYSAMVAVSLLTTLVTPPLLKAIFPKVKGGAAAGAE
ncbi:MAG TPA: cation:proton antiporter [Symbiobacteriaceae bacterium]|nr:cation:proton antiporter [Symbiobacteriaceae bacterium]